MESSWDFWKVSVNLTGSFNPFAALVARVFWTIARCFESFSACARMFLMVARMSLGGC